MWTPRASASTVIGPQWTRVARGGRTRRWAPRCAGRVGVDGFRPERRRCARDGHFRDDLDHRETSQRASPPLFPTERQVISHPPDVPSPTCALPCLAAVETHNDPFWAVRIAATAVISGHAVYGECWRRPPGGHRHEKE